MFSDLQIKLIVESTRHDLCGRGLLYSSSCILTSKSRRTLTRGAVCKMKSIDELSFKVRVRVNILTRTGKPQE